MDAQQFSPAPGISAFRHHLGKRFVQFYALQDANGLVLFDTALPGMVTQWIERSILEAPSLAIISHADADHLGDTAGLRQRFPALRVACHAADRAWIEDHDLLTQARYDGARAAYGLGYPPETLQGLRAACGDNFTVDEVLEDGQTLAIGGRSWQVLHSPGHSLGHLVLWNASDGLLLLSDAVLGLGPPGYDGHPSMPPTHQFIADYLATIERLRKLPVRLALPAHWDFMDGAAFTQFLDESTNCVHRALETIRSACDQQAQTPASLLHLLNTSERTQRTWDDEENVHYFYALSGYLDYLTANGALRRDGDHYVAD